MYSTFNLTWIELCLMILNMTLQVEEGGRIVLTTHDIDATDMDTLQADLAVYVDTKPSFGVLQNTKRG